MVYKSFGDYIFCFLFRQGLQRTLIVLIRLKSYNAWQKINFNAVRVHPNTLTWNYLVASMMLRKKSKLSTFYDKWLEWSTHCVIQRILDCRDVTCTTVYAGEYLSPTTVIHIDLPQHFVLYQWTCSLSTAEIFQLHGGIAKLKSFFLLNRILIYHSSLVICFKTFCNNTFWPVLKPLLWPVPSSSSPT